MESLRNILEHYLELVEEALYFVNALENEDYASEEDRESSKKNWNKS